MKIVYQKGDLLKSEFGVILHGVNTAGVMGGGVALAIRNYYPKVFEEYESYCQSWKNDRRVLMGKVLEVEVEGKTILNGFSQYGYGTGKQVSYDAVDEIMATVNENFAGQVVTMPMIGAGLGGGDWDVIKAIIEHRSTSFKPVVYQLAQQKGFR